VRLVLLAPLALTACWKLDLPEVPPDRIAFTPDVGAPKGWFVESFEMELDCPDGQAARFYLVYPDAARRRFDASGLEIGAPPALPIAIVFHSGAIDYAFTPDPADPSGSPTWQESRGVGPRLDLDWASERIFTSLGLYPNFDGTERLAGTLPAALAEKGIAQLWPTNCWGDDWHDRTSVVQNQYEADLFFRDGRTAAEFAWRYALESFPPGNPVQLPIRVDPDNVYLIGLGDGSRAVGELLSVPRPEGGFQYTATGVVLDAPIDDWSVLTSAGNLDVAELDPYRVWGSRVFTGASVNSGAFSRIPQVQVNALQRIGILLTQDDANLPAGANLALRNRFVPLDRTPTDAVWIEDSPELDRPLSNADPLLAKQVADFLGGTVTD
jgi:hypothetical protein